MKNNSTIMLVKIAGLVVLGFFTGFWVYMGLGEMSGGDWGGVMHLIIVAIALALMALAWKRPLPWGGVILVLGVLFGLRYGIGAALSNSAPYAVVIMSLPFVLSGLLLLLAGLISRDSQKVRKTK